MEGSFVFLIVYALPYFFFSVFVVGNTIRVNVPKKPSDSLRQRYKKANNKTSVNCSIPARHAHHLALTRVR